MEQNPEQFGERLTQGLKSIAAHEKKSLSDLRKELGRTLGLADWTIVKYGQGRIPPEPETVAFFAHVCVEHGKMDRQWLQSFLRSAGYPKIKELVDIIFPDPVAPLFPKIPKPLTSLIGCEREVEAMVQQLAGDGQNQVRLLTLYGAPGVGKTQWANEVVWRLQEDYAKTVAFVSLVSINSVAPLAAAPDTPAAQITPSHQPQNSELEGRLLSTIAETLKIGSVGDPPSLDSLKTHLQKRALILVLDNFDGLVEAAPQVTKLLSAIDTLTIIITSRQVLNLPSEHRREVPPLAVPDLAHLPSHHMLAQYAAVTLLVERCREINPNFVVTDQNAQAVAEICCHLDGLPLAIELVARDCAVFSPKDTLRRLKAELSPPIAGLGHQSLYETMYSAIAWSYHQLTTQDKHLFTQLSIFDGSFGLDAAQAVCGLDGTLHSDFHESFKSLLNRSLVRGGLNPLNPAIGSVKRRAIPHQEPLVELVPYQEQRYKLLEPIRAYASERLRECGEVEVLQRRHAAYFLAQAEHNRPSLWRPRSMAVHQLEWDLANLRTALRWFGEHDDDSGVLRMSGALASFWCVNGHLLNEALDWVNRARTRSAAPTLEVAEALCGVGIVMWTRGELISALAHMQESLNLFETYHDKGGQNPDGAQEKRRAQQGMRVAKNYIGGIFRDQQDFQEATTCFRECLALCRSLNDDLGIAMQLDNLGDVAIYERRYQEARKRCEEGRSLRQAAGGAWGVAGSDLNLARIARDQAEYDQAAELAYNSLVTYSNLHTIWDMPQSLEILATVAAAEGRPRRAAWLLGAAQVLREDTRYGLPMADCLDYDSLVERVAAALTKRAFVESWEEGQNMALGQVLKEAKMLLRRERYGLSQQEWDLAPRIGALLVQDKQTSEIADMLILDNRYVSQIITSICRKLELSTSKQIPGWLKRNGLA